MNCKHNGCLKISKNLRSLSKRKAFNNMRDLRRKVSFPAMCEPMLSLMFWKYSWASRSVSSESGMWRRAVSAASSWKISS